ncbi:MAG: transglutaminase domain-containing protein [Planctomycetia bacterium]|nr:transglutaminase domain-containing protein [Planctomycetia bacterium]
MRVDRCFRTSFYLSLAWACACMAYVAALDYPWEVFLAAVPLGLLLGVAYLVEGRWSLSVWVSNVLAVAVAALAGIYFARYFAQGAHRIDADWPLRLLPHMSFWLVVMMVLKCFRPKQVGDYWVIYGMGLLAVGLGCLLESDFPLGLLLAGYAFTSVWSLSLFYLQREHWRTQRPAAVPQPSSPAPPVPWRYAGLGQAVRRCLLACAMAALLFVVTPRHLGLGWEENLLRSSQMQSGLGDSTLDLNRTGSLRLSQEVAFEVDADLPDGQPKLDLNPEQRWRRNILNHYEAGRWSYVPRGGAEGKRNRPPPTGDAPGNPDGSLPDLGDGQFYLKYTFAGRLRWQLILADPLVLPAVGSPVVFLLDSEPTPVPAVRYADGELRFPLRRRHGLYRSYRQVTAPLPEPDLGPPVNVDEGQLDSYRLLPALSGLRERTGEMLNKLVERGRLSGDDIAVDGQGRLPDDRHERVARALENYLAQSGEYTYTLELRRKDATVDPVVDFLVNVKEGHCARYASALTAMLRTQGVPARVVLGFRGADPVGDGQYVVRQSHAHSWVEVLVQRPGPDGLPRRHWLTLDPTPGEEVALRDLSAWGRFWRAVSHTGGEFWRNFVTDYNSRQQEALWRRLTTGFGLGPAFGPLLLGLMVGGLLLVGVVVWRRRGRPVAAPLAAAAFYMRLLRIAARHCRLRPTPAQTPLEFAAALAEALRQRGCRTWEDFPRRVAELYYRVRFAGLPLPEAERLEIERRLGEFEAAVSRRPLWSASVENPTAAS